MSVWRTRRCGSRRAGARAPAGCSAQSGRPLVVTNKHVVTYAGRALRRGTVWFYRGADRPPVRVGATLIHRSQRIDLAILRLDEDPPDTARPVTLHTTTTVYRGDRVVLGGNPSAGPDSGPLPFQTTEGVVTGHVSGTDHQECGPARNCLVVDAASFSGSSGGPAFNSSGRLVGMLWGGPSQRVSSPQNRTTGFFTGNPAFCVLDSHPDHRG